MVSHGLLSCEEFFYFVYPILLFTNRWSKYAKLALGITLGALQVAMATHLIHRYSITKDPNWFIAGMVAFNPASRLIEFAIGIVTAEIFMAKGTPAWMRGVCGTLVRAVILIYIVSSMYLSNPIFLTISIGYPAALWLGNILTAPAFALLILSFTDRGAGVVKALSNKFLVLLGEISFSIYMTHQIIHYNMTYNLHITQRVPVYVSYPMFWGTILITSYLCWRLIERPARSGVVKFWKRSATFAQWKLRVVDLPFPYTVILLAASLSFIVAGYVEQARMAGMAK